VALGTRRWRLADVSGELQIELLDIPGSDAAGIRESRHELERLIWRGLVAREESARRLLVAVGDALRSRPVAPAGDWVEGASARHALEDDLRFAAFDGRLALRRAERPLTVPAGEQPPDPAPAPPPSTEGQTWFSLKVLDEVGDPVDGIDIAYSVGGQRRVVPTDGGGVARLTGVEASGASASLASIAAVKDKLKPRWKQPRDANVPDGDGITVWDIADAEGGSVTLDSETPRTLVLTPYFRCSEIPGAHFAFGRSFVLRAGLETLAGIAEEIIGEEDRKAMVFGHTDKSGPAQLNKELSERRAKAIYALFAQDDAAWEELWMGSKDGPNWKEKWGPYETKHMLNTLGVCDRDDNPLAENDLLDQAYGQAVKRFQRGDYPDKPDEQDPLPETGKLDKATRKQLFLAYAKTVSRKPVPKDKLSKVGSAPYMGCGLFNPLSVTVKDAESRRTVVFVYDVAAEPQNLPCKLRDMGPCKSNCGPAPTQPDPDGKPPYRCAIYKKVAASCPCNGGADLSHDLVVRLPFTLDIVNSFNHVLVVESDDGTIKRTATLKSDARAVNDDESEVYFPDLPPAHSYRMRAEGVDSPYQVFAYTPFEQLRTLSIALDATSAAADPPEIALASDPPDDAPPEQLAQADEGGGDSSADADGSAPADSDGGGEATA
jgi:outer membrane protein OmpA-like peptidoglycan-associated protein